MIARLTEGFILLKNKKVPHPCEAAGPGKNGKNLFAVEQIESIGASHFGQLFFCPDVEGLKECHTHADGGG